ncbi:hypothetical protein PHJA_000627600 [Phtheirospermum japonicum]|uniref:Uncharacterized protein n=1 Tax=Phtheirospermum japonicum TaxID=374723 RepID=A0A830BIA8_9LAMI|nr:hypothetical protein PHJA_000627600 [Phtheirospermum japonicum]
MAVNSSEECQSDHCVVVLPDGGATNMPYKPTSNISSLEVPKLMKSVNSEPILQNQTKLEADKMNNYAPCILDVDIEKGKAELTKFNEEPVANLKSGDTSARSLPREICLQIGGKLMQLLMNHGAELPKFASRDKSVAERVHDTPTNRSRKYKRSASFNSRRVVLLFSVL